MPSVFRFMAGPVTAFASVFKVGIVISMDDLHDEGIRVLTDSAGRKCASNNSRYRTRGCMMCYGERPGTLMWNL